MVRTTDRGKIKKIIDCLKNHPEGTYVSEIARETNLSKSTVSYLISKHLTKKIKEIKRGKGGLFKIIKLK